MKKGINTFQITQENMEFMNKYFFEYAKNISSEDGSYSLKLNPQEQEDLLLLLSELFIKQGLDKRDEPNEVGIQIEHLIDIFNPYK